MERSSLAQQPASSAPAPLAAPEPTSISVCIICRNEADKLPACLASVIWADEILVLDLNSADGSGATAAAYGARVLTREPHPIVEPLRNEIAAAARGAWVLALDPDEHITPGLARELRRLAQRQDLDAIVIPRMNWDLGYPPSSRRSATSRSCVCTAAAPSPGPWFPTPCPTCRRRASIVCPITTIW